MRRVIVAALAASLLTACAGDEDMDLGEMEQDSLVAQAGADSAASGRAATAALRDLGGRDAGTATLASADSGVSLEVRATGLAPGEHGIHVHAIGQCDAASGFASAGDHLNPTGAQHGLDNPAGPHLGDLPNLAVGADSTGTMTITSRLSIESLFDADGSALVVHAERDDQSTDPSGDSGDRIACGVIQTGP